MKRQIQYCPSLFLCALLSGTHSHRLSCKFWQSIHCFSLKTQNIYIKLHLKSPALWSQILTNRSSSNTCSWSSTCRQGPQCNFLALGSFQRQPLQVTKSQTHAGLILLPNSIVIQESTKDMKIFFAFSKKWNIQVARSLGGLLTSSSGRVTHATMIG